MLEREVRARKHSQRGMLAQVCTRRKESPGGEGRVGVSQEGKQAGHPRPKEQRMLEAGGSESEASLAGNKSCMTEEGSGDDRGLIGDRAEEKMGNIPKPNRKPGIYFQVI